MTDAERAVALVRDALDAIDADSLAAVAREADLTAIEAAARDYAVNRIARDDLRSALEAALLP